MSAHKRFRQGQILKILAGEPVASQDELRRRLAHLRLRVTQATLSRDLRELKLVKTTEGYQPLSAVAEEAASLPPLARAPRGYLLDFRPAQNLLVLKTPPGGAQPLAAAVGAQRLPPNPGTAAGGGTGPIITSSRQGRVGVQKK